MLSVINSKQKVKTVDEARVLRFYNDRPLSFISLSHSDNQSESTTKFYNYSKVDVGGSMLTLTTCVLRSDQVESFWNFTFILSIY